MLNLELIGYSASLVLLIFHAWKSTVESRDKYGDLRMSDAMRRRAKANASGTGQTVLYYLRLFSEVMWVSCNAFSMRPTFLVLEPKAKPKQKPKDADDHIASGERRPVSGAAISAQPPDDLPL